MRVVGIDIGSTNIKGCLFDLSDPNKPKLLKKYSFDCPLSRPKPGYAEHDLRAGVSSLEQLFAKLPAKVPVGLSSAMHALVLCDEQGAPLGNALSWADIRADLQAKALASQAPDAHARTGTPIHAMAWPAKLLWTKQEAPQRWSAVRKILDLKTYLLHRYTGLDVAMDVSNASATGLFNQAVQQWDDSLCDSLKIDSNWLPRVASTTSRFEHGGRVITLGAGDGPLGNLGVGAVTPDRLAISLGTSGAVRKSVEHATTAHRKELFQYALTENLSIQGGAISNGSSVLDWLRQIRDISPSALLRCAEKIPAGAEGLIVHPYFSGERAPFWRSDVRSEIRGWSFHHDFGHLVRACLEGVAYCLLRLVLLMEVPSEPIRCTGGLFQDKFWCQLLADITGCRIARSTVGEATALGAALLTLENPLVISAELPVSDVYEPRAKVHEAYRERYVEWAACSSQL